MEIETTPLYAEYKAIVGDGPKPVHYHWTMQLIAGGKTIEVIKVVDISIVRAYNVNYGDNVLVKFAIGAGTFHHQIYPYRTDLRAVLFRQPLGEVMNGLSLDQDIEAQVMRATLVQDSSAVMEANRRHTDSPRDMDITDIIEVEIGLTDLALEQLRMMTTDGCYRQVKTSELMRHVLTVASANVSSDADTAIRGVDLYPPSNEQPAPNIVVPTGTRLFELPDYLHSQVDGVYNSGFGFYLQKRHWYIYPTLDLKRYEQSEKGLTVIRLPPDLYRGGERTFRKTANQLIVLVGEEAGSSDPSEIMQLNLGNGVRYADAASIFNGYGKTENNKTTVVRKENNSEYLIENRAENINNIQMSPRRIVSNVFLEASKMAERLGMYLSCQWEHSDPGAIWPGMPVRYMFMAGGQVFESFGIVQAAQHYIRLNQPGITTRRHICSTSLLLFLGKASPWKD